MSGASTESALRRAIDEAKKVLANPSNPRPPLPTRSYLNWRDEDRVRQGLPPITDNSLPISSEGRLSAGASSPSLEPELGIRNLGALAQGVRV